ncbi:hypothetical protein CJC81_22395, partial [Escherichia coli]|nr:hypothetical protein [Escherichia coli]EFO2883299.1 hypothetical protein [Escherichia coli]
QRPFFALRYRFSALYGIDLLLILWFALALSGRDHISLLIPATPPCLIPRRMRKVNIEPGKLAITLC